MIYPIKRYKYYQKMERSEEEEQYKVKTEKLINQKQAEDDQTVIKKLDQLLNSKILYKFIDECERYTKKGYNLSELSSKFKLRYDLLKQSNDMKRILQRTNELLKLPSKKEQGWREFKIDNRCSFNLKSTNSIIQLKSIGTLQCNIKNLLNLAFMVKLYDQCIPFCKESIDIAQPTQLEKIGFLRLSFPIPFIKDRCTYLRGLGIDRLEQNGTVCIYAEGINSNEQYLSQNKIDISKKMKGKELLDVKYFAFELKQSGPNETSYQAFGLFDHHIPLLPESIIMFVAKQTAKYLFNLLIKQLKNFQNSAWMKERKQNYEENKYFYEWLQNRISSYKQ